MFPMFLKMRSTPTHQPYRPDIDGLRAIAVLCVVIFHAFPLALRGGFVGVDIFFVISGYLITRIIADDLDKDHFSFAEFYGRRIRRIFPALLVLLCCCTIAGWIFLLPVEFDQLGQHIAASAGFVSNFLLWSESGYFDAASKTKPLLHIWSLGIEEQFYIVWPMLLWGARKLKGSYFSVALALFVISFLDNLYQTTLLRVLNDPARLFYSPETRSWELLCGALLACCPSAFCQTARAKNLVSAAGLGLLIASTFLATYHNYPGVQALLPVAGCVLLIACGEQAYINRTLLSNPLLVKLGLISFPFYLWHWPLLSFARIIAGSTPSSFVRLGVIIVALLLAILTYHFVEKPIRFGKRKPEKTIALIIAMALIGCVGLGIHDTKGIAFQNDKAVEAFNQQQFAWSHWQLAPDCLEHANISEGFCVLYGNPQHITTAIIGDSNANAIAPGLATLYANAEDGLINLGHSSCPPVRGVEYTDSWHPSGCQESIAAEYKFVLDNPSVKTVIMGIFAKDVLVYGLPDIADDAPIEARFKIFSRLLDSDIRDLTQHGKKVVINFDSPYLPYDPRDCMKRALFKEHQLDCQIPEDNLLDWQPFINLYRDFLRDRTDVCAMNLADILIQDGKVIIFDNSGRLLMRDNHHVGDYGSEQAAIAFKKSSCANRNGR